MWTSCPGKGLAGATEVAPGKGLAGGVHHALLLSLRLWSWRCSGRLVLRHPSSALLSVAVGAALTARAQVKGCKRRAPTFLHRQSPSPRRRADGTLSRPQLDQEIVERHRGERVLNAEVLYSRCYDRLDRKDVRLHQPRH